MGSLKDARHAARWLPTVTTCLLVSLGGRGAALGAEVATVHVLDHQRQPAADVLVELIAEGEGRDPQRLSARTDANGRAAFPELLLDCRSIRAVVRSGEALVSSRPRTCEAAPDLYIVLPSTTGEEESRAEAPTDLDGRPLLFLPPGVDDGRIFRDRRTTRRFVEPGLVELGLRVGLDLCVGWLGSPEGSCEAGRRAGTSAVAEVALHLIDHSRLTFELGLELGYRFSRSAFERAATVQDQEHHLFTVGPLLVLVGDADDWIFGIDLAPLGFAFRSTRVVQEGHPTARDELGRVDGFTRFGLFGGWRAWGHVPLGLYLELFQPLGLGGSDGLPPGTFTVGVFAGRRVGRGRAVWTL